MFAGNPLKTFCYTSTEAVVRICSVKKLFLKVFAKVTGKHICRSLFLNEVGDLRPVNSAKFLRTYFFTEHLWWLLLPLVK